LDASNAIMTATRGRWAVAATLGPWADELDGCDDALAHGNVCNNRSGLVLRDRIALATSIGSAAGAFALGTIATIKWTGKGQRNGSPASRIAVVCAPAPARAGCEATWSF